MFGTLFIYYQLFESNIYFDTVKNKILSIFLLLLFHKFDNVRKYAREMDIL
jgi:hypothetical protein